MASFGASSQNSHDAAFDSLGANPPFATPSAKVGCGPILLKNSDFGQNRKIFPCTELEENFGEGFGQTGLKALLRFIGMSP
jgi:hypothetical protein